MMPANPLMFEKVENPLCYNTPVTWDEPRHRLFDKVENDIMTRDEARGQAALKHLPEYIAPMSFYIAEEGKLGRKLYALERKRSELFDELANVWSAIFEEATGNKPHFWKHALPQVLHDTLENYQAETAITAAEAYLKRHGWTVIRPELKE